jgi:hypothetical protein
MNSESATRKHRRTLDEANRAERRLGDAIGRYLIEAIDAGLQPPLYVAYVSVSGAPACGRLSRRGVTDRFIVGESQGR